MATSTPPQLPGTGPNMRADELRAELHRLNKRLCLAHEQIDEATALVRSIHQRHLLPSLSEVPGVRFAVYHRPSGRVGGDFYDLFRLDESHVGFFLADAMGHGLVPGLLALFLKQQLRAKEIEGDRYRLVRPGEVLQQLNRELIAQQLADGPVVSMLYGLFNHTERQITFARSGHPCPLYLPSADKVQQWQVGGTLLGVVDCSYPEHSQALRAGDRVFIFTDGLDGASSADRPVDVPSLIDLVERHRTLPLQELIHRVAHDVILPHADDVTLLGLEVIPLAQQARVNV